MLGSVSHGKSTLVEYLSKRKPYRYSDEEKRDCTIHLGYENFKICRTQSGQLYSMAETSKPKDATDVVVFYGSLLDCPGHKEFMDVAVGATGIMDSVLLVIAANEPIQSQTHQHILAYLSSRTKITASSDTKAVMIHNKLDLVTKEQAIASHREITEFMVGSSFEDVPMIPTSLRTGRGTDDMVRAIVDCMTPTWTRKSFTGPGELSVVRSFDLNRNGRFKKQLLGAAFGGAVSRGVFRVGEWIEIKPGLIDLDKHTVQPLYTKIQSIYSGVHSIDYALPGGTIAISTGLDPSLSLKNNMAGQTIGHVGTLGEIVDQIELPLRRAVDLEGNKIKPTPGMKVKINNKTMTVTGQILTYKKARRTSKDKATATAKLKTASIQLDRPICIIEGAHVAVLTTDSALIGDGDVVSAKLVTYNIIKKHMQKPQTAFGEITVINDLLLRKMCDRTTSSDESSKLPLYADLLKDQEFATTKETVKIPSVDLTTSRTQVEVNNMEDIIAAFDHARSDVDWWLLLTRFIQSRFKMSTSKAFQNNVNVLRVKGNRLTNQDVENILRAFISDVIRCTRCKKSIRCVLNQTTGRTIVRNCLDCGGRSQHAI